LIQGKVGVGTMLTKGDLRKYNPFGKSCKKYFWLV